MRKIISGLLWAVVVVLLLLLFGAWKGKTDR